MAANEFEKNVRKEMEDFKFRPSETVWPKIEERIREKNRKRRILFFILFSLIGLIVAGYGIYNFSGSRTKSEAQFKLPDGHKSNTEDKTSNSKNTEPDKETITNKQTIPAENSEQIKHVVTGKQEHADQSSKPNKQMTSVSKENSISRNQTTVSINSSTEKQDNSKKRNATLETTQVLSINQKPEIIDSNQKGIAKPEGKNLPSDTARSNLKESNNTRSVDVVTRKKSEKVSNEITWGIDISAGSSVITEDAFSFKSSYATADRQYSAPGSNIGGTPSTGAGGAGGPTAYYNYSQSQNKPAFAFKVGINARKNISNRSSLSVGLGYSQLADKIEIGTNQSPSQSSMALSYYSGAPQQTHTDHFHFIELPLSYNWRVTNNADRFLSLNAGVSPSYLLATNALVYDTTMGGIYYDNKDVVTKAHFSFTSGISYQFKNKRNLEFSIGPQFSFDITKVFKSDLDKRKYFLYTGIDARIFFEKKTK